MEELLKNRVLKGLMYFGLSLIIFIISFPVFEPDFSTGMDASFSWAINYLFHNDFETLIHIYCTYGPLGVLKKPVVIANNFIIAIGIYTFLKLFLINFLLILFFDLKKWYNLFPIILISLIINLDTLFILLVVLCFSQFLKNNKWYYVLIASILSLIALYIKPSFGFACFGVGFVCGVIMLYQRYELKKLFYMLFGFIVVCVFINLLLFGNGLYFIRFLSNTLFITNGYSASLSLFPNNNWLALLIFLLSIISIPIIIKNKTVKTHFVLMLIPLFIAWKYAIVREDYSHYKYLIDFTVLFFVLTFLVATNKDKLKIGAVLVVSVFALIINAKNIEGYNGEYAIKMNGIENIKPWLFSFNDYQQSFAALSLNKIEVKKLPQTILDELNNGTVDIFPWELTYIPANNLKWKPRQSLMSLHMSGHHELLASKDLNMKNGPDYILFHWKKDSMEGSFGSIDFRHLFNDSPTIIYNLFNDYKLSSYDKKVGIFKKRKTNALTEPTIIKEEEVNFNEWVVVPENKNGIIRCVLQNDYNLMGKMKGVLYKGEAFYIEYELITSEVRKYRFIPSIAENGLWVSPLIKNVYDDFKLSQVKKVRFTSSNNNMVKDKIKLKWQKIDLQETSKSINTIFSEAKKI